MTKKIAPSNAENSTDITNFKDKIEWLICILFKNFEGRKIYKQNTANSNERRANVLCIENISILERFACKKDHGKNSIN